MTDAILSDPQAPVETTSLLGELLRILVTVLLPPLGVALRVGFSVQLVINLVLTFLGYLPGLIHGIWLLAQTSCHRLKA